MTEIEYSQNSNDFYSESSEHMINGNQVFNQWTGISVDPCSYKQQLNLSTKPLRYYVNSLNNPSGTNNPNLAITPVGNMQVEHIRNTLDRPIPSTLQRTSGTYTLPYQTSPFLGSNNNVNTLDTDADLTLKTGLNLRHMRSGNDFSDRQFPHYGDIHRADIESTVQNAGQTFGIGSDGNRVLSNRLNQDIAGLNEQQSIISSGIGVVWPDVSGQLCGSDTYNMSLNIQSGPYKTSISGPDRPKHSNPYSK